MNPVRALIRSCASAHLLVIFVLLGDRGHAAPGRMIVTPKETPEAILHNPDMGWVLYENYPLDSAPNGSSTLLTLPGETSPEVDAAAIMFSWQDIEKEPGRYDFSRVDFAYDYWKQRGKAIQLRLSTESLLWWATRNPPAGTGIPEHVLAHIPAEQKRTRTLEGIPYVVVDARNAYYQERLRGFLHALGNHYDERRPVTLVDLRGFGVWGEWHSGYPYPDLKSRHHALAQLLKTWAKALPQQRLALSYSYDPDGPKALYAGPNDRFDAAFTTNYTEFLYFSAFDEALKYQNMTFRRDGCGGAIHSNERKLNEQAFKAGHAPMFSEFLGAYDASKKGGPQWAEFMVRDALSLHPNYICLMGWQGGDARQFIRERPDLLAQGLRRMGYRLVPTKIEFFEEMERGRNYPMDFEWVNRGVGRALRDYTLEVLLVDNRGAIVEKVSATAPCSRWYPDEPAKTRMRVRFHRSGQYLLCFRLLDQASGKTIELPLERAKGEFYCLGEVKLR